MLKWLDIIKFANREILVPDRKVEKTEEEWKKALTPEQFSITRLKDTERAHSSEMCYILNPVKCVYMIVTELEMFNHFYKAEDYHQDYYNQNDGLGYCQAVINPKLKKVKELFRNKLKN